MHAQASQRSPQHGRSLWVRCDRGASLRREHCGLRFFALFLCCSFFCLSLRLLTCPGSMLRNRSFRFVVAAWGRAACSGAQLDNAEGDRGTRLEPKRQRTRGEELTHTLLHYRSYVDECS